MSVRFTHIRENSKSISNFSTLILLLKLVHCAMATIYIYIFIFTNFIFSSDFFEPGVPPELVRASRKDSSVSSSPNVSINGKDSEPDTEIPSAEEEPNEEENNDNIFENIRENQHLSTIQEDE